MENDRIQQGWFWVLAQGVLLVLWVLTLLFSIPWTTSAVLQNILHGVGLALAVAGCFLAIAAVMQLGRHLTPTPRPRPNAPLITTGVYGHARHPIYGGIILFVFGVTLIFVAPLAAVVALLLLVFFILKSQHEERLLRERFPEYGEYAAGRKRLIPWVI
jgi:protein-S-isoprenylcysteine O-methyltransferase Ste14